MATRAVITSMCWPGNTRINGYSAAEQAHILTSEPFEKIHEGTLSSAVFSRMSDQVLQFLALRNVVSMLPKSSGKV